jgi:hypothetical protein
MNWEAAMNRTPAVLGLLALTLPVALDMRPVAAETYRPWCLHDSDKAATSCAYASYDQCMMTARGGGGTCRQNPWYLQYGERGPAYGTKNPGERTTRR